MDIDLEKLTREFLNNQIVIGYANEREAVEATAMLLEAGIRHGDSGVSKSVINGCANLGKLMYWDSIYADYDGGIEYFDSHVFTHFPCNRVMLDELAGMYPSGGYETEFEVDEEIFKKIFRYSRDS